MLLRQIAVASSLLMFVFSAPAQSVPEANKLVKLNKIELHGSRLDEEGLMRLSGLAVGNEVNDLIVNKACHKITSTGLVKKIDYAYDVYPDLPGVTLVLTLKDEAPLLPAKILPEAQEAELWKAAEDVSPLLKHDLPPNEAALKFYAAQLEIALKKLGHEDQYVTAILSGDANSAPTGIVFAVKTYKKGPTPSHSR